MAMSKDLTNRAKQSLDESLEILGIGVKVPQVVYEPSIMGSNYMDLKRNVIDEVLILLARLEQDRKRTELQLEEEKRNVLILTRKLDKLGLRRNHDLPILVQKEHEACITDITELEWHIAYHSQILKKLTHKVEVEEKFFNQLKSEIDDMSEKIPLMQEKCSLELKSVHGIQSIQEETDAMLNDATKINEEVTQRNMEAHAKANKEITDMKYDLDMCNKELNKSK
jgi:hypothetical protein